VEEMNLHDCHFFAYYQRSSPKGDEDLTHDDETNSLIGLTEMNHETHAEDFQTQHRNCKPLKSPQCADKHSNYNAPKTTADRVYLNPGAQLVLLKGVENWFRR
jgi:hypothetical protein